MGHFVFEFMLSFISTSICPETRCVGLNGKYLHRLGYLETLPPGGVIYRSLGLEALLHNVCQWENALRLYSFALLPVYSLYFLH